MTATATTTAGVPALLAALPAALGGDCEVRLVDAAGVVTVQLGVVRPLGGCVELNAAVGDAGARLVVRVACERARSARVVVDAVATALGERMRIEREMDSVFSGSLQLLEEVSMTASMLTQLPSCVDDREIVHLGLESLVVGASVERALWLGVDPDTGLCSIQLEVAFDPRDGALRRIVEAARTPFDPGSTIVARALRANAEGILESVAADRANVPPGVTVQNEVLAVPARFGDADESAVLGVLLVVDKRANSYASASRLGSQECKMSGTVALMIASALGNRRAAIAGQELAFARTIQQQVLPDRAASVPGFTLVGRCETSGAVGGDYFDFVPMADDRTLALVADVSGHNLASGMLMVGARAALRVISGTSSDPSTVLDVLARAIHDDLSRTERFITVAAIAITPHSAGIEFVGAGHPDALVLRAADGKLERLESTGPMLGFLPDQHFPAHTLRMEPGDLVLLYTDGVIEATDADGEEFGEARLIELLGARRGADAESVLDAVFAEVAEFRSTSGSPGDDITVVVLRREAESEGGR